MHSVGHYSKVQSDSINSTTNTPAASTQTVVVVISVNYVHVGRPTPTTISMLPISQSHAIHTSHKPNTKHSARRY